MEFPETTLGAQISAQELNWTKWNSSNSFKQENPDVSFKKISSASSGNCAWYRLFTFGSDGTRVEEFERTRWEAVFSWGRRERRELFSRS
jgi:hypothetical protein